MVEGKGDDGEIWDVGGFDGIVEEGLEIDVDVYEGFVGSDVGFDRREVVGLG